MSCSLCPRCCKGEAFCQKSDTFKIARADLHFWEEPCISGTNGSGTIFFSGCNMGCVFCQNSQISKKNQGKAVSGARLKEIFNELYQKGAHNINLVTPTHYTDRLIPLLKDAPLPIVWNSSAYENVSTLKALNGAVDIYLADLKFSDPLLGKKYANAPDYPQTAQEAIKEMFRQRGRYVIEGGIMKSGVIIRHLIMPDAIENTYGVIDWVADNFKKGDVLFSLMSQYTPYHTLPFPELNRRITRREYILCRNYMLKKGITEGYVQQLSSAKEEYTPAFDLTGV